MAPSPEGVSVPAFRDYTAPKAARGILKGEVRTFKTEKTAAVFAKAQKLKGFKPREIEPGVWALSKPLRERRAPDRSAKADDSAATIVQKLGGWNRDDAQRDGVDPAEFRARPFLFRRNGGLSIDAIAEALDQQGFDVRDENGAIDAGKAREIMEASFSGPVYSAEGMEIRAAREAEARARFETRSTPQERAETGYDDLSGTAQAAVAEMVENEDADSLTALPVDDDIADIPFGDDAKGLTDEEADRLFGYTPDAEGDRAGPTAKGAVEGAEGRQEDRRSAQAEVATQGPPEIPLRGDLELTSETESEIRTREARERAQAESKKKREAAPDPSGFTLTGSDRPVDEAEARGQEPLFARLTRRDTAQGLPTYSNVEIGLAKPRLAGTQPINKSIQRIAYDIFDTRIFKDNLDLGRERAAAKAKVGEVLLDVRDGVFVGLYNIKIFDNLQGKGYGRQAVRSMLESQDTPIHIYQIEESAVDFWVKMGAKFPRSLDNMEADLDRFQYAAKNRSPSFGRDGAEGARGLRAGTEEADAASGPGRQQPRDSRAGTQQVEAPERGLSTADARFRRGPDSSEGINRAQFDEALAKAFGKRASRLLIDEGVIEPVATQENLPAHIVPFVRDGDVVFGFYDPRSDKTYAVLENLSPEMVKGLALHEVGVHYGFERMLGQKLYADVMRRLDMMHKAGNAAVVEAREAATRESAAPSQIPEETLAYLVTNRPELSLVQRIVSAIKAFLFRKFGIAPSMLNEDDLAALARAAVMHAAKGEAPMMSTQAQPAWHRAKEPPKFSRASKPPAAAQAPDWIAQGPAALQSAASKIDTFAPGETAKQKIKGLGANWKERLIQGMFDAYAPLKRLGPTEYVKARMVKSSDGALEGMLLYGKPVMGEDGAIHGDIDNKGFLGAMKELGGEHDRFFMWVAGQRAERLMGEKREHLFTPDEIRAMKALDQGKMRDGTPRPQAYARAAETLRTYNKAVLDIAEKTGLIDGEARHLWEHDFYVPFFRMDEDSKIEGPATKVKGLVRQQAFKKLTGGTENLGDLMANTLRNWSHLLSASMANQAAVASLQAAERVGVAEVVPEGTKGATYAMVGGRKVHYEVSDPFILTAISAMESASFKGLPMQVMGRFKHYLTLGVTASPTFRIRNLMRDSLSAIGQNEMSYNVLGNLYRGFKGTDRKGEQYAQMLFSGALMRFGQLTDGKHADHAKRLISMGVKEETILTSPEKAKAALGKLWDEWQELGDKMENVNRAAIYRKFKDEGKSDIEAAFAARDMLDFSLQGSWTAVRFLTQIVPFMNARLQGLYRMGRAAKDNPARLGYVAGAVSLASIALMLAYGDDDEWKKREDWDRDQFWWFRIGDTAYRIPKPFEIGAIGTLAERSLELMISDEMTGKRFRERMKAMVGDTLSLNPTPQLFKPMLDLYSNVDSFTGRQIESRAMQNLSKPERMTPHTSLVAKLLGKGGNVTNLSPVQIDHMIRSYFGWLGAHAAMTVDLMAEPFMDAPKPARRLGDIFVIGDFVKDLPSDRSRYVEQFYKQAKEVHEVMGDLRQAREAKDAERVREILAEKRTEVSLSKFYNSVERRMGEINRRVRLVHASSKSPDEKRAELDRLNAMRNNLAKVAEARATRAREAAGR